MTMIIICVEGEKAAIQYDEKRSLSELRAEYPNDIPPNGVFMIQGAPLVKSHESSVTIKEALDDGMITISVKKESSSGNEEPHQNESIMIALKKGDKQKSVSFNPDKNLSKLRSSLSGFMLEKDLFEYKGAPIAKDQESKITVKEILDKNTLSIKSGKKESVVKPGKPGKADTSSVEPSKTEWTLKSDDDKDATQALDKLDEERSAAKSEGLEYYYELNKKDKKKLILKKLQINHGLLIQPKSFDKSVKTPRELLGEPIYTMPDTVLDMDKDLSFSKTTHEVRKRFSQNAKGSVGVPGLSVSASYSHEKESLHSTTEQRVYLLVSEDVPKVILSILPENIRITGEFSHAIDSVLQSSESNEIQKYFDLLGVLNEYGYFMPMKFVLGGQIWAEDTKTIKQETNAEREMESFAVAFEADLEVSGAPVQIGGGYGQLNEEQKKDVQQDAQRRISKRFRGGDPAASGKPATWIASLAKSNNWDVIRYLELKPTLDLLDDAQRSKCAEIINKHAPHPETHKLTALDMEGYAANLNAGYSDDFV
ncbi:hypothetical protein [Halomonas sp.]|uniref:hypothetical protein n=1 Tax=Halomonas sp. TaxID=1486246 RepID=UPI00298EA055|nr:hypothetical protein [Halomonas sp.]MDW7662469.1 hypothetical protein [Bacillota bacterium]MDW7748427.1 hypothetical protein [Halomonas sp.]